MYVCMMLGTREGENVTNVKRERIVTGAKWKKRGLEVDERFQRLAAERGNGYFMRRSTQRTAREGMPQKLPQ
jgi:hypothetical protein